MSTRLPTPILTSRRANAVHSTGPRTETGQRRSALNALTNGLTSQTAVLPSEDPAAYQLHCSQFQNEYQPQTPTEIQLVHELADTAWRLNRLPLLEADLFACTANPPTEQAAISFDIVDTHPPSPPSVFTARASPISFRELSTSPATSRLSAATSNEPPPSRTP
jgi:hypothetical protein